MNSSKIWGIGLLFALLGAQTADAAQKKTVGEILKQVNLDSRGKQVTLKKASSNLPTSKPVKPVSREKLEEIKPPKSSVVFRPDEKEEAELQRITDQGIAELYKLAQKFRTSPNRGEIWLRLAEHYTDKARLIDYRKRDEHDRRMAEFDAGKTKVKPVLDVRDAHSFNNKAIELYEWFLRDFPRDPRTDQALYFLGYNYIEMGQLRKGVVYYERMTKEFPNSMYINEAHFALGEHYFDSDDFKRALFHYQHVARDKRARLYSFALYKTAWCTYRVGDARKAVLLLEEVINDSRQKASSAKEGGRQVNKIRLATEALKDIIRFYGEIGDPNRAKAYFTRVAGEKALFSVLERLAYLYSDLGKKDAARFMFKEVLAMRPTAPKAFDYQYQIVLNYAGGGNQQTFRAELYTWITEYGPNSAWAEANANDKELLENAFKLRETTLKNNTLQLHKTAQDTKAPAAQAAAKEGYDLYLKSFSDSKTIDEMRFFYGELLYDMKRYTEAATQYDWVASNAPKSQYREQSIMNNLLALEKGLPSEESLRKKQGDTLDPIEYPASVVAFEKAAQKYLAEYPKGQKASDVKFKLGRLKYSYNHFDEALSLFQQVVKEYPKTQNATYSANLILDIYNLKKDYAGLIAAGKELESSGGVGDTAAKAEIAEVVEKAKFKRASELEGQKNYVEAAKEYEKFARENPKSELATSARFNSAVDYERGGEILAAIGAYGLVLASKDKKAEPLKEKTRKLLATLYEKTGQYAKAVKEYETFVSEFPKDAQAADILYNAAMIRLALGDTNNAIKNFDKYAAMSKKRDKVENNFLIAEHFEDKKNYPKALAYYKKYIDEGGANPARMIEAHFKIGDFYEKQKARGQAEEWYKKTIAVQSKLKSAEGGGWYAAEAKFRLVQDSYGDLKAIKISDNPKKQGAETQKKLAAMTKLGKELSEVIKYDSGDQVVSSLVVLAQANDHMYRAIDSLAVPKELNVDQVKEYKDGVAKITGPFKQGAQDNFIAAVKKSHEIPAYNEWVYLAAKGVEAYDPQKPKDFNTISAVRVPAYKSGEHKELDEAVQSGHEEKVIEEAAKILAKNNSDISALGALVVTYMRSGRTGMARMITGRALKDHPNEPSLHNNIALMHLAEKREEAAITEFRKALAADPENWQASANLGTLHAKYLNYDAAVVYLEKARDKKGDDMAIAANYAVALTGVGKHNEAKAVYDAIKVEESKDAAVLLNYAALLVQHLNEKTKGQEIVNKIKYFSTDSDILKKARMLTEGA